MRKILPTLLLSVLLIAGVSAETLLIDEYQFDNPLPPTKVERLSESVFSCHWPAGSSLPEAKVQMIVATLDASTVSETMHAKKSVGQRALKEFMGITSKPTGINKTLFFGKTSARKVFEETGPRAHEAHVFGKFLSDGSYVQVGIRLFEKRNSGGLISAVANSFSLQKKTAVTPPKKKAWYWFGF